MDTDEAIRVRVPAKINLTLGVGPREDDGYHQLATVFQAISVHDELTARAAPDGVTELVTHGPQADLVPAGPDNLVWQAADLLRNEILPASRRDLGVRIDVTKAIPVAGGMAGGSADAAAALLACSVLWDLDLDPTELRELSAGLGADVPFALTGGTAVGTGRGDRVVPALTRGTYHWVLVFSETGVSTPAAFARHDELRPDPPEPSIPPELMAALGTGRAADLAPHLYNDLAEATCSMRPDVAEVLGLADQVGALTAILCGSGPTVAFLVADENAAVDAHLQLRAELGAEVGMRRVHGPVPGARLVSS
ncbi:MAG TPA: 4-(cytidine 5'-diphospho)-2-C-methyl-D-erythritol kinase [Candidatus Avipropionibacterium avicola]|uniref:4-diphosphocytidyl-2-C-methyl-D-erythritol kinase n=1 Tax=Candidatus Avipropionibacterium avicola TaxID=2840701 RepID=A0A9D1GZJ3_9ACTN|nr:4-(cytidine 5'-diphospho)-2-C-methyl-D-erythritol kinase [Candidatus Avipropionibacterium avicola]